MDTLTFEQIPRNFGPEADEIMEPREIDAQLDLLRDRVLLLGGKTEEAVNRAVRSLTRRDSLGRVFDGLIEKMAKDSAAANGAARLLFVAKHIERIGDYVKDICELNVYLIEAVFIKHGARE